MRLFSLTVIWNGYRRSLSVSNASWYITSMPWVWMHRDWSPLYQRLVVRRRPSGPPLTASRVYVCIYSPRPPPTWEVGARLQLFHRLRMTSGDFPVNSSAVGSQPAIGFSRCLGLGYMFLASRLFRKACFCWARFPLVSGRSMGFRGVWTPASCFPHRDTSGSIQTSHSYFLVGNVLLTRW